VCKHFDTRFVLGLTDTPERQAYGQDMHSDSKGGTMRHKKQLSIKLVALGFAVTAIAAPSAQAMPDPWLPGEEMRALQQVKAKSVRPAKSARTTQPVTLPRRPIREYEPGESG
jgi:hypothetical protein